MSKAYKKKETALFAITEGENFKNKIFDKFRNDRDCVLAALKVGVSFTHYPQEWLGDKEMSHAYLAFMKSNEDIFFASTVGSSLLDNKEFIVGVFSEPTCITKRHVYFALSKRLQSDIKIAALVVFEHPQALLIMDESLRINTIIQHAFIHGVDQDFAWSESVFIAGDHIGLPIRDWGRLFEKDDFHRMIDRRAFSQSLEAQLPAKSVDQQTIKI